MSSDSELLSTAARWVAEGRRFALVTIVRTQGSTPRKLGAKMLVGEDGSQVGSVGGGRIEQVLVDEAKASLADGKPRLHRHHLTHDLAMCCGGEMEAFVEPMGRKEWLVLVGAGHCNRALAPIALSLGFDVVVADEEESAASAERFPGVRLVHAWDPGDFGVPLDTDTYVVVATRDHAVDQQVLEMLAARGAQPAYLGVIGSRGKLGRFRKRLQAKGVADAWIEQVRGPIGLDIGAETPVEIAVAVAAELVAVRRRRVAE